MAFFSILNGQLQADTRVHPLSLGQRYALCSAWWDYQFEAARGRLGDNLPKTRYSRIALDLAVALSNRDTATAWVGEHLANLRAIRGGMLRAAYYQEARVDTYLCKKMVENPTRFRE